ncbi:predicted protein [Aspergillus terreus NIH2624]|uniref:Dienelactone hydrolase n=1 Tax=Aspergillus terreus (strain NIH 2624 / FGSC A1156) TaxID=341663 RepID=Q0CIF4_ASPTN|nr:uncharacterized protein ATEG_06530 [Aspergillus terreus NIH2624]EAU33074.1 predicted protein [Aspergillus terreus NIH2624]
MASFVSFSSNTARLCITSERGACDRGFLRNCEEEGFDVTYIPFTKDTSLFVQELNKIVQGLGAGESYAVVGFGAAAAFCLEYYVKPQNTRKIRALVAYYPTRIPGQELSYPSSMRVLLHLANEDVDVFHDCQSAKRHHHREIQHLSSGLGVGDRLPLRYSAFVYSAALPGFAERSRDSYEYVSASLAWSRTLGLLQEEFGKHYDLEETWDKIQENRYFAPSMKDPLASYVRQGTPSITFVPTLQGATGREALRRFYANAFPQGKPPSMKMRLISRTIGADRVVDEIFLYFKHTQEMPWILPHIPPTHREVRIIIINIVCVRGGLLYSEHVYWDQASVLVQVGLLDPKSLRGHENLAKTPIVGGEAAKAVLMNDRQDIADPGG